MKKTITCICSLVPIVFVILGFGGLMVAALTYEAGGADPDPNPFMMILLIVIELIGVIMCWVDIIWFIVLTCKRKDWDTGKKVVWSIVLYMLNIFVFPIYWFLYLRTED